MLVDGGHPQGLKRRPELVLQRLSFPLEVFAGLIDSRGDFLNALRQGLLDVLRKGALKLRGESAGVAFQPRTDRDGIRFHARDILVQHCLRFGSASFELLLSNVPGAILEESGSGLATFRHLLAGPLGGLLGAFS